MLTIVGTSRCQCNNNMFINNKFQKIHLKIFEAYNIGNIKFFVAYFMILTLILYTFKFNI